jgi:hypothetical protein
MLSAPLIKTGLLIPYFRFQMGNFFAFKYTLRGTAEKLERKNMTYALMAHVIREGGFKVAMIG